MKYINTCTYKRQMFYSQLYISIYIYIHIYSCIYIMHHNNSNKAIVIKVKMLTTIIYCY